MTNTVPCNIKINLTSLKFCCVAKIFQPTEILRIKDYSNITF